MTFALCCRMAMIETELPEEALKGFPLQPNACLTLRAPGMQPLKVNIPSLQGNYAIASRQLNNHFVPDAFARTFSFNLASGSCMQYVAALKSIYKLPVTCASAQISLQAACSACPATNFQREPLCHVPLAPTLYLHTLRVTHPQLPRQSCCNWERVPAASTICTAAGRHVATTYNH